MKNIFKISIIISTLIFVFIFSSQTVKAIVDCHSSVARTEGGTVVQKPCTCNDGEICGPTVFDSTVGLYNCVCNSSSVSAPLDNGTLKLTMPQLQIAIPGVVFSEAGKCADDSSKICVNWIQQYIAGIYKYAVGAVGILATIIIMIGGVIWLTAGGDATRLGEAKAWIVAAITGLALMLSSYLILYQINPDIINVFSKDLRINIVNKIADDKVSNTADDYSAMNCPISELNNGDTIDIYKTGYCKPPWGNDHKSLCNIALNCECPGGASGRDNVNTCGDVFSNPKYAKYPSCKPFPQNTPYCTSGKSGATPRVGTTIAAPDCIPFNTKICIDGVTYTVQDRGSKITGHRIDIWDGTDCSAASNESGKTTMHLGDCGPSEVSL